MRSIVIFPLCIRATAAALDGMAERLPEQWVMDGAVYINVVEGPDLTPDYEYDEQELQALHDVLGGPPSYRVDVDVSGRIVGLAQVRELSLTLLGNGGVALDDYSSHLWTREEIAADETINRALFFRGLLRPRKRR